MVLLRLRMIPHEDIRRKSAVWHDPPDRRHSVQVPLPRIFPVHQSQYPVASALHRQMNMLAHIRHLRNHPQRLIAHILRMTRRKPDAHIRRLLCHHPQQPGKGNLFPLLSRRLRLHGAIFCWGGLIRLYPPVRIHILSQECDLLVPFLPQVSHLPEYTLHVPAPFSSSCIRNDAIMTKIIAPPHDTHESPDLMSQSYPLWHHIPVRLRRRQLDIHRLVS